MGEAPRALPPGLQLTSGLRGTGRPSARRSSLDSALGHELSIHHPNLGPRPPVGAGQQGHSQAHRGAVVRRLRPSRAALAPLCPEALRRRILLPW
eukprot:scaffold69740_cov31-Tisochrysis_lutea.AAC.1